MGRTNLPSSLTTFIGRESELGDLRSLLRSSRLVTLTGSGGVGKTRLALETARGLIGEYVDGIWFVDLAPIADGRLIPHLTAEALGLKELPFQEQRDQLLSALSDSVCLIVLDNCEHVIEASATFVDELLHTCPEVKLLATSREPLGVPGEVTFPVPPLALPPDRADVTVRDVHGFEAVQLFVERARLADPHLEVDDQTLPVIVGICRTLDGLPLAIELAAARLRSLNLGAIATGLDERFRLLTGGPRTALSRQQTLLASVEWSYGLLTPEQQKVFGRLGVFAGYFSATAAQAVCGAGDVENVSETFLALVERSLVQVDRHRRNAPYRLLETLREFAAAELKEAGEMHSARDRHLDFYAELAISLESGLQGSRLTDCIEILGSEHENLRMALDWGAQHHVEKALRMTAALSIYWFTRGHWAEAKRRAALALEASQVEPEVRGAALAGVAMIAATALDAPTALTFGEAALELGRSISDKRITSSALLALGSVYAFIDPDRARPLVAESIEMAREAAFEYVYVRGQTTAAIVETQSGEFETARSLFSEASDSARKAGTDLVLVPNRLWLVWTCAMQGDFDEATSVANEGIEICRRLGNPQFEGYLTSTLSVIATYTGDYGRARTLAKEARLMAETLIDPAGLVGAVTAFATLGFCEGSLEDAEQYLDEFIPLAEAIGPKWAHAGALVTLSELQRCREDLVEAVSTARAAGELARGISNRWMAARARLAEGRAMLAGDDFDTAARLVHETLATFTELDVKPDLVGVLNALGMVAGAAASWEEAARLFQTADHLCEQTGFVPPVPITQEMKPWTTAVRNELDPASFERVRRETVEMGAEGVIAYVSRGWGRRSRPRSGWESLTPTELKVVELVAEGLTNPQIGERMFISRRTAQTHLTHIFGKIGLTSRSELAAEATRRGLST